MADKTWVGAAGGSWNVAGNWSPAGVPVAGDNVFIANPGDVAGIPAGITTTGVGVIDNSGTIALDSPGAQVQFRYQGVEFSTLTITGGGTLDLGSNATNVLATAGQNNLTILNQDNTIQGSGGIQNISGTGQTFINAAGGTVDANGALPLFIGGPPAGMTFVNQGVFKATSSGGLVIRATVDNTGGSIQATGPGSVVTLAATQGIGIVAGGALESSDGGKITLQTGSLVRDVAITSGSLVTIEDGQRGTVQGTIDNQGTIALNGAAATTELRFDPNVLGGPGNGSTLTLTGGGTIDMSASAFNRIGTTGDNLTILNQDNTIQGAGTILNISGANNAFVNGAGGQIVADGSSPLVIQDFAGFTNDGTLRAQNGATLEVQANVSTEFANLAAGTLTGGTYDVVDPVGGGASTIRFTGAFATPIATLDATVILAGATSALVSGGTSLANSLTTIGADGTLSLFYGFNSGTAQSFVDPNAVTIDGALNLNGANFTAASVTVGALGAVAGSGVLTASGGTINVDVDGTVTSLIPFGPDATSLAIVGDATGGGTFLIGNASTLEFRDGTAATLAANFDGLVDAQLDTLEIDDAANFLAAIGNLDLDDRIHLTGLAATTAAYDPGTSELVISNGGGELERLALAGDFTGRTFSVESDGAGGSIIALDELPVASISAPNGTDFLEGTNATFLVTIDNAIPIDLDLNVQLFTTIAANAASLDDFDLATAGFAVVPGSPTLAEKTVTIPAGQTSVAVEIPVIVNDDFFSPEPALLRLRPLAPGENSGYTIDPSVDFGVPFSISDNPEPPPTLSIAATNAVQAEGNAGSTPFTFTVTRDGDTSGASTVDWAVTGNGAVAAANAADFGGTLPSGTVSFAAGETSQTITINVSGDATNETDEGFLVTLSNATGATIATAEASGTIQNDDGGILNVTTNNVTVEETNVTPATATRIVAQILNLPDSGGTVALILNADGSTSVEANIGGGGPLSADAMALLGTLDPGLLPAGAVTPDLPATIDVANVTDNQIVASNVQQIDNGTTSATDTTIETSQTPDTIWIGDLANPTGIIVLTGQLDITITNTTTNTQNITELTVNDQVDVVDVTIEEALALLPDVPALAEIETALQGLLAPDNTPPVAVDDAFATDEATALSGNVLAENGSGPDSDADGNALTVTAVNGMAAGVGQTVTLASGALLTLNADGSFAYDPNGAFDALNDGEQGIDSFTYTIDDGNGGSSTATASIAIDGISDGEDTPPAIALVKTAELVEGDDDDDHDHGGWGSYRYSSSKWGGKGDDDDRRIQYTLEVTNVSTDDPEVSLLSLIDDNGTPNKARDDFDVLKLKNAFVGGDADHDGLVDIGETWVFRYTQELDDDLGGTITNSATATAIDTDGNVATAAASATIDLPLPTEVHHAHWGSETQKGDDGVRDIFELNADHKGTDKIKDFLLANGDALHFQGWVLGQASVADGSLALKAHRGGDLSIWADNDCDRRLEKIAVLDDFLDDNADALANLSIDADGLGGWLAQDDATAILNAISAQGLLLV